EHVREAIDHHAHEGGRPALPLVLQLLPALPSDIDAVEAAGDGVEAGGVDDDVELELPAADLEASPRDPLDRRVEDADQFDVRLVVDLVVVGLLRNAAGAEAVVLRNQPLRDLRIL